MNTRHKNMSRISGRGKVYFLMNIFQAFKFVVTAPTIGAHFGAKLHDIANEWYQAIRRKIRHAFHSDTSVANWLKDFQSNNNDTFSFSPSASFSSFVFTAYKCLIYLYNSMKLVASGPHHRPSHFMEPTPCRLVTAKAKCSLEPQSVPTEFLAGNIPNGLKPQSKRFSCSMEYCPGKYRGLLFALGTTNQPVCHFPTFCSFARRASKTFWPAKSLKIFYAILFRQKPLVKFLRGSWVMYPTYGICLKLAHSQLIQ